TVLERVGATGVNWTQATLESCRITDAHLDEGNFSRTIVRRCQFSNVRLLRSMFDGTVFVENQFRRVSCARAIFVDLVLEDADFSEVDFYRAHLKNAVLLRSSLTAANLDSADLHGARLDRVDLSEAHLAGARLDGAALESVRMNSAVLRETSFDGATGQNLAAENVVVEEAESCPGLVDLIPDLVSEMGTGEFPSLARSRIAVDLSVAAATPAVLGEVCAELGALLAALSDHWGSSGEVLIERVETQPSVVVHLAAGEDGVGPQILGLIGILVADAQERGVDGEPDAEAVGRVFSLFEGSGEGHAFEQLCELLARWCRHLAFPTVQGV
ncbi:MAG: pentapeptide repeat-containing protein, partial [Planctomycetota bacterium]